jgi:hypothetical protein
MILVMKTIFFRYVAVLVLLVSCASVSAQQLRFEKDSLGQVLQRAQQLQKPVFLLFASPSPPASLSKEEVKKRYGSALDDTAVATELQRDFLLVKVLFNTPVGQKLSSRYRVSNFPAYLYLHPDGTVLHRSFGNTHDPQRYLRDIAAFR